MLDKPTDFVVIFALIGITLFTVGLGIDSINNHGAGVNTAFYDRIEGNITSSGSGFAGISSQVTNSTGLDSTAETSDSSLIVDGFNAILKVGAVYSLIKNTFSAGAVEIGLDPMYITLVIGALLIIGAIVSYTWIIGR